MRLPRSQFEEEHDLGRDDGEVGDETLDEAWQQAERRQSTTNVDEGPDGDD